LCVSTHIVPQIYDKPNTLILEREKYSCPFCRRRALQWRRKRCIARLAVPLDPEEQPPL